MDEEEKEEYEYNDLYVLCVQGKICIALVSLVVMFGVACPYQLTYVPLESNPRPDASEGLARAATATQLLRSSFAALPATSAGFAIT